MSIWRLGGICLLLYSTLLVAVKPSPEFERCAELTSSFSPLHWSLLRQHGNKTLSYATTQTGLEYFTIDEGFIAFQTFGKYTYVLGDPVVARENLKLIIEMFLNSYPDAVFGFATHETAAVLSELGFYINELGEDSTLSLPEYNFEGKKKAKLRQAARKLKREEFTISELSYSQVSVGEVQAISDQWRSTKEVKHQEVRFLNRPMSLIDEVDVRKYFVLSKEGKIVSFVYFDPIYEKGEIIGYSASIKRRSPLAPTGAEEATMVEAISKFKEEGKQVVHLGVVPLQNIEDNVFGGDKKLTFVLKQIRRHGDGRIYSFSGHQDFKHRFRGEPSKVYFASRKWWNGRTLFGLMRISNVFTRESLRIWE